MAKAVRVNRPYQDFLRLRLQFCGFDVHQYVGDTRIALLDCSFHTVCNLVAFMYGNVSVHADV